MNHVYAVIMAGGQGERLWPLSTPQRPKQFLNLFGKRTMLQQTVDRVLPLVSIENMYVVTASEHVPLVKDQLPEVLHDNIVGEPAGRGTAPCVGLAALLIQQRDPDGVMLALAADHVIKQETEFRRLLETAIEIASQGTHLITFGIDPTRPETGYGYIHAPNKWEGFGTSAGNSRVLEVSRFTEKPDRENAEHFLQAGTYYWNSGMFVWGVSTILDEIEHWLPELYGALQELRPHIGTAGFQQKLETIYADLAKVSIDNGVMEKSTTTLLIPAGKIAWSDVGGWEALRELLARTDKPWGHEQLWALNQHYAGKFLHINAGESLSLQYHQTKDETIHVISGRLRLKIGAAASDLETRDLLPGQSCPIPPGTVHQMEAVEDCIIAEVSTPQLTDVVRLEDRYGRIESL